MSLTVNAKILACPVCMSKIGLVDFSKLSLPLRGSMFDTLYPEAGTPPPFADWASWLDFRCKRCRKRPYQEHNVVYTMDEAGFLTRHEIPEDMYKCGCGAEYQHKQSLIRHKKDCTWKK